MLLRSGYYCNLENALFNNTILLYLLANLDDCAFAATKTPDLISGYK